MKTLKVLGMVPLVLMAATAFPQGASHRGGGGGGGSSSAGARHTAGGGGGGGGSHGGGSSGGAVPRGGSGGGYSSSGAQNRHPQPGTGTGHRDYYGNQYSHYGSYGGHYGYYGGYYGGYYPYSYYYAPYAYWGYPGYAWGFGIGYGYGYGYGAYGYGYAPAPYYYGDDHSHGDGGYGGGEETSNNQQGGGAQVRTLIDPAKTRVYVDGYYAGTADDFDGMFQRLNISPGRHDITFKLDGYATHVFSVSAGPGETLKLRWDMVKGSGETRETVGQEFERRLEPNPSATPDLESRETEPAPPQTYPGREPAPEPNNQPVIRMSQPGRGDILFDILPLDASVYIDGEFHGKASQVTQVQLPFGRHRVEVVRPGYRTEETEVNVDAEGRKIVVKLDRR